LQIHAAAAAPHSSQEWCLVTASLDCDAWLVPPSAGPRLPDSAPLLIELRTSTADTEMDGEVVGAGGETWDRSWLQHMSGGRHEESRSITEQGQSCPPQSSSSRCDVIAP
jgi:hypothetical protein